MPKSVEITRLILVSVGLVLIACGPARPVGSGRASGPATLRISGSDSMLQLVRLWAERYMVAAPGVSVYVWGGGSAKGIDDLLHGRIDLCAVSRTPNAGEAQQLAARYGSTGMLFTAAKEALSIYVHPQNPVRDLKLDQLRSIFNGDVRNWRELGGPDLPVVVVRRAASSGTYLYFQEHVLDGAAYSERCEIMQDTQAVVARIRSEPAAIGYGGIGYGRDLHCRVEGVAPSEQNVREGIYPVTRYLYFLALDHRTVPVQQFLDWVQGPAGQQAVRDAGLVSLW